MNPVSPRAGFVNGIPVINNLNQLSAFSVNQNSLEQITNSLYDSAAYPTTGAATINFFANASNLSAMSGNAKTLEDTNVQGGALQNLNWFVIQSIELDVQPAIPFVTGPETTADPAFFGAGAVASSINDVWIVRTSGYLNLQVGSKPYLTEGPLMKFPASNDLEIDGAFANATTPAAALYSQAIYAKAVGPSYQLAPNNLLLIPLQQLNL